MKGLWCSGKIARGALLGVGPLLAALSFAQAGFLGLQAPVKELAPPLATGTKRIDPMEPRGFPQLFERRGPLPLPVPSENEEDLRLQVISADEVRRGGDEIFLRGNAEFLYRGYRIFATEAHGNTRTKIFELEGKVRVIGKTALIDGDWVRIDFNDDSFEARQTDATLHPKIAESMLLDDLFVHSRSSHGKKEHFFSHESEATTCDYEIPHFFLAAREIEVRPGKRVILRDARLSVLGRTILGVPYLSIPLDRPDANYLPKFGHSPDEGYYVKSRWGVVLPKKDGFDALLEAYTKLGTGLGGEYTYQNPMNQGFLRAFGIYGKQESQELIAQHTQNLGWGIASLDHSQQRRNHLLSPSSTLESTRAQLMIPQGYDNTRLSYYRTSSESSGFLSVQQNLTVNDRRRFGSATMTDLTVSWVDSSSRFAVGDPVLRELMDVRFRGTHDLRSAQLELDYQRSIPIGQIENFYSSSDRTPVVTLSTDAARLFGRRSATQWPFRASLSLGEFTDGLSRNQIQRSAFELNMQKREATGAFSFDANGRFRQSFYSDDTAQYLLNLNTNFRYAFSRETGFNLRYNYLNPFGYTPLQIDRTGETHQFTGDLNYRPMRPLLLGAQTGYDFLRIDQNRTPWQLVGLRAEYEPNRNFFVRSLATYDPDASAWSNIRLDATFQQRDFYASLGARYDGLRHRWANMSLYLDGLTWGRLRIGAALTYNGYLERFEARHLALTYDLHCAEAVLQIIDNPIGFRSGTEILFFIRLKALPFDSPFGTGTRGQPLGTASGRNF